VVRASEGLFLEVAREVRKDYPDIKMDDANVDAICMWLLKNPRNYDVLVATNMFGDIVSDLAAQMVGGLGFGCSGNIGQKLGVFEPSHGSAPKYAGQYKVNPIATVLSAKMMLDWLGETEKGAAIERAVAEVIKEGRVRTYDMGGSNTSLEMGEAIAAKL
jgi:3-isopropylmalate dehydrogenase